MKGADREKYVAKLDPMFGSERDWTGGLLAKSWGTFDGIAQHWYEGPGRHFDLSKAKALPPDAPASDAYVTYEPTSLEYARYAGDVIRRHAEEWQGYQKHCPHIVYKEIFHSIVEYAYVVLGPEGSHRITGQTVHTAMVDGML